MAIFQKNASQSFLKTGATGSQQSPSLMQDIVKNNTMSANFLVIQNFLISSLCRTEIITYYQELGKN